MSGPTRLILPPGSRRSESADLPKDTPLARPAATKPAAGSSPKVKVDKGDAVEAESHTGPVKLDNKPSVLRDTEGGGLEVSAAGASLIGGRSTDAAGSPVRQIADDATLPRALRTRAAKLDRTFAARKLELMPSDTLRAKLSTPRNLIVLIADAYDSDPARVGPGDIDAFLKINPELASYSRNGKAVPPGTIVRYSGIDPKTLSVIELPRALQVERVSIEALKIHLEATLASAKHANVLSEAYLPPAQIEAGEKDLRTLLRRMEDVDSKLIIANAEHVLSMEMARAIKLGESGTVPTDKAFGRTLRAAQRLEKSSDPNARAIAAKLRLVVARTEGRAAMSAASVQANMGDDKAASAAYGAAIKKLDAYSMSAGIALDELAETLLSRANAASAQALLTPALRNYRLEHVGAERTSAPPEHHEALRVIDVNYTTASDTFRKAAAAHKAAAAVAKDPETKAAEEEAASHCEAQARLCLASKEERIADAHAAIGDAAGQAEQLERAMLLLMGDDPAKARAAFSPDDSHKEQNGSSVAIMSKKKREALLARIHGLPEPLRQRAIALLTDMAHVAGTNDDKARLSVTRQLLQIYREQLPPQARVRADLAKIDYLVAVGRGDQARSLMKAALKNCDAIDDAATRRAVLGETITTVATALLSTAMKDSNALVLLRDLRVEADRLGLAPDAIGLMLLEANGHAERLKVGNNAIDKQRLEACIAEMRERGKSDPTVRATAYMAEAQLAASRGNLDEARVLYTKARLAAAALPDEVPARQLTAVQALQGELATLSALAKKTDDDATKVRLAKEAQALRLEVGKVGFPRLSVAQRAAVLTQEAKAFVEVRDFAPALALRADLRRMLADPKLTGNAKAAVERTLGELEKLGALPDDAARQKSAKNVAAAIGEAAYQAQSATTQEFLIAAGIGVGGGALIAVGLTLTGPPGWVAGGALLTTGALAATGAATGAIAGFSLAQAGLALKKMYDGRRAIASAWETGARTHSGLELGVNVALSLADLTGVGQVVKAGAAVGAKGAKAFVLGSAEVLARAEAKTAAQKLVSLKSWEASFKNYADRGVRGFEKVGGTEVAAKLTAEEKTLLARQMIVEHFDSVMQSAGGKWVTALNFVGIEPAVHQVINVLGNDKLSPQQKAEQLAQTLGTMFLMGIGFAKLSSAGPKELRAALKERVPVHSKVFLSDTVSFEAKRRELGAPETEVAFFDPVEGHVYINAAQAQQPNFAGIVGHELFHHWLDTAPPKQREDLLAAVREHENWPAIETRLGEISGLAERKLSPDQLAEEAISMAVAGEAGADLSALLAPIMKLEAVERGTANLARVDLAALKKNGQARIGKAVTQSTTGSSIAMGHAADVSAQSRELDAALTKLFGGREAGWESVVTNRSAQEKVRILLANGTSPETMARRIGTKMKEKSGYDLSKIDFADSDYHLNFFEIETLFAVELRALGEHSGDKAAAALKAKEQARIDDANAKLAAEEAARVAAQAAKKAQETLPSGRHLPQPQRPRPEVLNVKLNIDPSADAFFHELWADALARQGRTDFEDTGRLGVNTQGILKLAERVKQERLRTGQPLKESDLRKLFDVPPDDFLAFKEKGAAKPSAAFSDAAPRSPELDAHLKNVDERLSAQDGPGAANAAKARADKEFSAERSRVLLAAALLEAKDPRAAKALLRGFDQTVNGPKRYAFTNDATRRMLAERLDILAEALADPERAKLLSEPTLIEFILSSPLPKEDIVRYLASDVPMKAGYRFKSADDEIAFLRAAMERTPEALHRDARRVEAAIKHGQLSPEEAFAAFSHRKDPNQAKVYDLEKLLLERAPQAFAEAERAIDSALKRLNDKPSWPTLEGLAQTLSGDGALWLTSQTRHDIGMAVRSNVDKLIKEKAEEVSAMRKEGKPEADISSEIASITESVRTIQKQTEHVIHLPSELRPSK